MKIAPKEIARAFYLAVKRVPPHDAKTAAERLVAILKEKGLAASLPDVLDALPDAMKEVDAEERVTVESARELDDKTFEKILAAAGIDPEDTEVVRRVVPELIGGVRIRTQDGVIDASVRRKITALRRAGTTASHLK